MSTVIVLLVWIVVWVATVRWFKRNGSGVLKRHLAGAAYGALALVIGIVVSTPEEQGPVPSAVKVDETTSVPPQAGVPPPVTAASTPAELEEAKQQERRDAQDLFAVKVARAVKERLNDPDSFKVVKLYATDLGGVCLRYRAKNGFNATITDEIAVDQAGREQPVDVVCHKAAGVREVPVFSWAL